MSRVATATEGGADYNIRILWPLARYLEDRGGADALGEVARAAGLGAGDFDGKNRWVSAEAFERVLKEARGKMDSDAEYQRACVHRLPEAYGPLRYLLWATSPGVVLAQSAKHYRLVSTCGEMTVEYGRTFARGHFRSHVPYSRLNCLCRIAQATALPTLWGLPEAHFREHACIARGDPTCEYEAHWYTTRRWMPIVLSAVAFAIAGLALVRAGIAAVPTPAAMGLLGAALGYIVETRRTERANERTRGEIMNALQELATEEAAARRELLDMHGRQKEWTRLVEEEMTSRSVAAEAALGATRKRDDANESTLLGYSHDLRNPLTIIFGALDLLHLQLPPSSAEGEAVAEMIEAAGRMKSVIAMLVGVVKGRHELVRLTPRPIETAALVDSLRRRLRALVFSRDIRSTVMATREVPASIEIDPLALDRIVDNLLTNAAKYTERGSILVEVEGKPGFLVVKVSDTGRGIAPEALKRVFEPGGSDPATRRGDGLGIGLSVVVRLLEQLGGRLDVMSTPDVGTTFWVELPVHPAAESEPAAPAPANVVRIRRRSA